LKISFISAAISYSRTCICQNIKKKFKNLKHRQSCVKATLMKSGTRVPATTADKEVTTEQTKKPTRTHEGSERVLSNARNQTM